MSNIPIAGEVWRSQRSKQVREVTFVSADDLCDDGKWASVGYMRPSPATEAHATVTLKAWWEWVSQEGAIRTQKTWRAA